MPDKKWLTWKLNENNGGLVIEQMNDLEDELVKYVKRELPNKIKYGFKFDKAHINVNISENAYYTIFFFVIKYKI